MLIGRHISTTFNFASAPLYSKKLGCDIIQVFLGNPIQALSKPRSKEDLASFKSALEKYNIKLVIHGAYSINLCRSFNTSRHRTSIKYLVSELKSSAALGPNCLGVIIHMGKNISDDEITNIQASKNYSDSISLALKLSPPNSTIILETGAGVGSEIGSDLEVLSKIYHKLNKSEKQRIKFCIDTCHIWAMGYDISDANHVKKFFTLFDKLFGIDKIACFHFNNSKNPMGAKVDRHADLLYGQIPLSGLKAIAKFAARHSIPLITETPLDSIDPLTNKYIDFASERKLIIDWIKN